MAIPRGNLVVRTPLPDDEVIAHLDPARRAALYDALAALSAQVWMTGADPAPFADVASRANVR